MSDHIIDFLVQSSPPGNGRVSAETRDQMEDLLDWGEPEPRPSVIPYPPSQIQAISQPGQPSNLHVLTLARMRGRILEELENHVDRLYTLNPSRRSAVALHLSQLAGKELKELADWIEGPRTPLHVQAVKAYLEEVALITLGQILVLKNWSDRGIRTWSAADLGRLNWALSTALKPFLPLDREGWHITRPNLYSWYVPSQRVQQEIWGDLESLSFEEIDSSLLRNTLLSTRKYEAENKPGRGYDSRFYQALWNMLGEMEQDPVRASWKKGKVFFSPTLRDGSFVRLSPQDASWVGLESCAFYLMLAELEILWEGPLAPPLWAIGSGLEAHPRDQLSFALGGVKSSLIQKLAEHEACDLAVVLEEQTVRLQGRGLMTQHYKQLIEQLPFFKKMKPANATLGILQACVAMSKLRPGAVLWWAREEPLTAKDGQGVLAFLLERAKLLGEWNFENLEHQLPNSVPLFPKYIYLFQRDVQLDSRLDHKPIRLIVRGHLRSHVEVPVALEDVLEPILQYGYRGPQEGSLPLDPTPVQTRGPWGIQVMPSPIAQRHWIEKWPDCASQDQIMELDRLRSESLPLASFCTIRPAPEDHSFSPVSGMWIAGDFHSTSQKLQVEIFDPDRVHRKNQAGFLVTVSNSEWLPPLMAYLKSTIVNHWLEHYAERRGDRWIIQEQIVKWIPVPKALLDYMQVNTAAASQFKADPLPSRWTDLLHRVADQPEVIQKELLDLDPEEKLRLRIHAAVFMHAALALEEFLKLQNRLFSLVGDDGKILWPMLLDVLPSQEIVSLTLHPKIRISGTIPPHFPISKWERTRSPQAGVILSTETGFAMQIRSEQNLLIQMLWEQLTPLQHPTWSELVQYLKLPRHLEMAEATAFDLLRSHEEQVVKMQRFQELLNNCQLF